MTGRVSVGKIILKAFHISVNIALFGSYPDEMILQWRFVLALT